MDDPTTELSPANGFEAVVLIDMAQHTIVRCNDAAEQLLGLDRHGLPAPLDAVLTSADLAVMTTLVLPLAQAGQLWQGELRLGPQVDVEHHFEIPLASSLVVPLLSPLRDASDAAPEYASLVFGPPGSVDASRLVADPLTGLPTRSTLVHHLQRAVWRNHESDELLTTVFVDLDGLKQINDRFGHQVGDLVLKETAQHLLAALPDGALAVRFGGDEFVIIHEEFRDIDNAVVFADEIRNRLSLTSGYQAISASIGLAFSRSGEVEPDELLRRADAAMYRAKALGGNQVAIFDAEMHQAQRNNANVRTHVIESIHNNGFGVAAQPIFELATGIIGGVELFIRVRDDGPYIGNANELFRLAYEYGEAFDGAVLGRALSLATVWRRSLGDRAPRVQINVSAQSLAASAFADRVEAALNKNRVGPSAIGFEIDSASLASCSDATRSTIEMLRTLGVPLIVDGFGTNEFSLAELAELRPAQVKLDGKSLSPDVLRGLLRATSSLHIPVCLKGIETDACLAAANAIGGHTAQGNALSPVSAIQAVNDLLEGPTRIGF